MLLDIDTVISIFNNNADSQHHLSHLTLCLLSRNCPLLPYQIYFYELCKSFVFYFYLETFNPKYSMHLQRILPLIGILETGLGCKVCICTFIFFTDIRKTINNPRDFGENLIPSKKTIEIALFFFFSGKRFPESFHSGRSKMQLRSPADGFPVETKRDAEMGKFCASAPSLQLSSHPAPSRSNQQGFGHCQRTGTELSTQN